jgi:hypothetical protein
MMDKCHKMLIFLNLKKCILCTSFMMLVGHVVCKEGLLVDQEKIVATLKFYLLHILDNYTPHWATQGIIHDSFRVM